MSSSLFYGLNSVEGLAFIDRYEGPFTGTGEELTRATDALGRVLNHLIPLGNPANSPGNREQHGEHGCRNSDRSEDDAGIEIDVRIKLPLDKVIVFKGNSFEFYGHFK